MPEPIRAINIEEAMKDPEAFFSSPMDVVDHPRLSSEEKEKILVSWCDQAELLSEATAENMTGGQRPRLQEAKLALLKLRETTGKTRQPTTKR